MKMSENKSSDGYVFRDVGRCISFRKQPQSGEASLCIRNSLRTAEMMHVSGQYLVRRKEEIELPSMKSNLIVAMMVA